MNNEQQKYEKKIFSKKSALWFVNVNIPRPFSYTPIPFISNW